MNLPGAARHMVDLISKLKDEINQIENDPKLAAAAKDLGGAWDDTVQIGKDLG